MARNAIPQFVRLCWRRGNRLILVIMTKWAGGLPDVRIVRSSRPIFRSDGKELFSPSLYAVCSLYWCLFLCFKKNSIKLSYTPFFVRFSYHSDKWDCTNIFFSLTIAFLPSSVSKYYQLYNYYRIHLLSWSMEQPRDQHRSSKPWSNWEILSILIISDKIPYF